MNLWCPNCTQPLIVPEQVAGQPMHCPLCACAFTAPSPAADPGGGPSDTSPANSYQGAILYRPHCQFSRGILGHFDVMMVTNHRDLASSGGEPSSTPLGAAMDDLFADIAEEQALSGFTDSRWFYVVKDGLDDFGCQAGPLEQPSEGKAPQPLPPSPSPLPIKPISASLPPSPSSPSPRPLIRRRRPLMWSSVAAAVLLLGGVAAEIGFRPASGGQTAPTEPLASLQTRTAAGPQQTSSTPTPPKSEPQQPKTGATLQGARAWCSPWRTVRTARPRRREAPTRRSSRGTRPPEGTRLPWLGLGIPQTSLPWHSARTARPRLRGARTRRSSRGTR